MSPSELRFPREIFILIFESVGDPSKLRGMRLVSREFEDLIVPIVYRNTTITQRVVLARNRSVLVPFGVATAAHSLSFYRKIALFTKHVVVDRALPFDFLRGILVDLEKVETLT